MELRPIVIDESGMVLGGNMRLEALKSLGKKSIPDHWIKRASELSEEQKKEFIIKDNSSFGEYDWDLLANEWGDYPLAEWGVDIPDDWAKTPAIEEDEAAVGEMIDRAAELQVKWATETGQLWEIGKHRLLVGDATDKADVGRLCADKQAQMVFTDPPYGVDYDGGAKKREKLANDHIGSDVYGKALPHLQFAADDQAALYLWYADGHVAAAAAAAAAAGYVITAQIVWLKNNAQFVTSAHYKGKHEPCFYAHRKGKSARWYGPNNEVTVWECDRAQSNDYHPTQKPVALAERAMRNSSISGDIVLDLFLGGGATMVAAEQSGRVCYGLEISPAYVAVSLERLSALGLTPKLIENE